MKKITFIATLATILTAFSPSFLLAKGAGTSGGLTLIEASGARAAALAEAFSAMSNELCAMNYNPGSLGTLQSGQASFMYQKGMMEDSYGQFLIGAPTARGAWGLQVGYYNGGTMDISYDGVTSQTVNAQKDVMVNLGLGRKLRSASVGVNLKYLSSQLIEKEKATAYAADFGLSMALGSRVRVGGAVQNIGTQLKYVQEGDSLPRIVRAGMAVSLVRGNSPLSLLVDAPYFVNEAEVRPALGLELGIGALALRAGYRKLGATNEFTIGTGFLLGKTSFDYSFGMMQDLESQQRVSLSMRFGGAAAPAPEFAKKKEEKKKAETVVALPVNAPEKRFLGSANKMPVIKTQTLASRELPRKASRVYFVKPGDSLGKISSKYYGRSDMWKNIYNANKHLIDDPKNLEPGQKILIP